MKKSKLFKTLIALLSCGAVLCGCSTSNNTQETLNSTPQDAVENSTEESQEPSESNSEYTLYADLSQGPSDSFEVANAWTNGYMFNCTWRDTNCTFENGKMQLSIDFDADGSDLPYSAAEYRTRDFYGYGKYEVSMKPIKNDGVVSSFFTYTGPSDDNPWDEIDIEFLGKDTTIVQFNYFTDGVGEHEFIYDLGFDASEDFHTYGFEWHEDKIIWFVDGQEVYSATENIPSTPSKIMMNVWPGTGVDDWLNAFDDSKLPITAEYEYFAFTAF